MSSSRRDELIRERVQLAIRMNEIDEELDKLDEREDAARSGEELPGIVSEESGAE